MEEGELVGDYSFEELADVDVEVPDWAAAYLSAGCLGRVAHHMPAFICAGRPLLGFRAAQKHLRVFPFSPAAIESVKPRLEGFELDKGNDPVHHRAPVPDAVLVDLVGFFQSEIKGRPD